LFGYAFLRSDLKPYISILHCELSVGRECCFAAPEIIKVKIYSSYTLLSMFSVRRMVGRLLNDDLRGIWKEIVVA
jgi:hypothetical protein